jgi:hypothetical protein
MLFIKITSMEIYKKRSYLYFLRLKLLPCETGPAEVRLIRKVVVKERGTEVFWKNPPAPIL